MIVWIDTETTGLDPHKDYLLEFAVVITDDELSEVDRYESVIKPRRRALRRMDDFVANMHTKSGLLANLPDGKSLAQVEAEVLAFLDKHDLVERLTLAGNSVYFDKAFIENHMPTLAKRFSHQILDVTSIANCAKRWHAPVYWGMIEERDSRGGIVHRAISDVLSSIKQLEQYRNEVFVESVR